jgi:amino acid transporter
MRGNWATDKFITNYLPLILFPLFYIVALLWIKTKPRKPLEMDFVTGIKEIEAET